MFDALSRFTIRNEMARRVREAFRARPHLVDAAQGFLWMEVRNPIARRSAARRAVAH